MCVFKFILSERVNEDLWGSDVLLFSEFINIVSTLDYTFIETIILLYTFLVLFLLDTKNILFDVIHLVGLQVCYQLFLVQVLLVIFERIWLGVNILRCKCSKASQSETLATSTTSVGRGANIPARERLETLATWAISSRLTAPLLGADKNIPLLKPS